MQVFNVTPYLHFHPGGMKYIMIGAGRDATSLFNKYHAWVNIDFLMSQCLVGLVEAPSKTVAAAHAAEHGAADSELASETEAVPPRPVSSGAQDTGDKTQRPGQRDDSRQQR